MDAGADGVAGKCQSAVQLAARVGVGRGDFSRSRNLSSVSRHLSIPPMIRNLTRLLDVLLFYTIIDSALAGVDALASRWGRVTASHPVSARWIVIRRRPPSDR